MATKRMSGFTLIELMAAMSIFSVLAVVVLGYTAEGQERARDAKRIAETKQVEKALLLYNEDIGEYPGDVGQVYTESDESLAELFQNSLIASGYLSVVPESGNESYTYMSYGSDAVFGTSLETVTGATMSCRNITAPVFFRTYPVQMAFTVVDEHIGGNNYRGTEYVVVGFESSTGEWLSMRSTEIVYNMPLHIDSLFGSVQISETTFEPGPTMSYAYDQVEGTCRHTTGGQNESVSLGVCESFTDLFQFAHYAAHTETSICNPYTQYCSCQTNLL